MFFINLSNVITLSIVITVSPTYYLTFSCNEINWLDMRKALFIADGRLMDNIQDLDMITTQRLIEIYLILRSHFMYRFNAIF